MCYPVMPDNTRRALRRLKKGDTGNPDCIRTDIAGEVVLARCDFPSLTGADRPVSTLLDRLIADGTIIKHDATSTVARATLDGCEIVIKRFNKKGVVQLLKTLVAPTRAEKGFFRTLLLLQLDIPTPEPLLCCFPRKYRLSTTSYLITARSGGETFCELFDSGRLSAADWPVPVAMARDIIHRLHINGITHGDIKTPNLLYDGTGVEIIDLDPLRIHRLRRRFRHFRDKDLRNFSRRVVNYPHRGGVR